MNRRMGRGDHGTGRRDNVHRGTALPSAREAATAARERLQRTLAGEMAKLTNAPLGDEDEVRLDLLLSLHERPADEVAEEVLPAFVRSRCEMLVTLYRVYRDDARAASLLFVPDALLILERLEHDPDRLRRAWEGQLPIEDLEAVADIFGLPV